LAGFNFHPLFVFISKMDYRKRSLIYLKCFRVVGEIPEEAVPSKPGSERGLKDRDVDLLRFIP